jgi:hypothetical protein
MRFFSVKHCLLPLALLLALRTSAQTYLHTALWLRIAPSYGLSERWSLQSDVLYRRQSHPEHTILNLTNSPQLHAGRVGLSYRTPRWVYTLWPVVYFHSYPSLGNAADLRRAPVPEWRPSVLAEYTYPLPHHMALRLRAGYEYRMFTSPDLPTTGRFRARALLRRDLNAHTYLQFWNETLLTAPPNVPADGHVFELNRSNIAIGYAVTNRTTLEFGYQFTHRQRRTLIEFDAEHALCVTLFQALARRAD